MRRFFAAIVSLFVLCTLPVRAARPLLDYHQWDAYFALFARDQIAPWKHPSLRLDTYSGVPVDFAAYAVDPVEVIVAGANSKPRAIDTSRRTAVARWRFTPPPGYKFESNDVTLPLGGREGFFVIEARRGAAAEQVWVNLSRVGLVTRESPGGLVLYGCDLGSGRALRGMRITYLAGSKLVDLRTDANGVSRWTRPERPRFALAQWGSSVAFVSLLPQSPVPPAIVGVRVEQTVLHAGSRARVIGFARRRSGPVYRAASGDVRVLLSARGRTLAQTTLRLDAAGAFSGDVTVPADTPTGDIALIASSGAASSGASLHVDAAGDAQLAVSSGCAGGCAPDAPIPISIRARRDGVAAAGLRVRLRVIRTPHILPPGEPEELARWGTTTVIDRSVVTGAEGTAAASIPEPTDGLSSTYAVVVSTSTATAAARVVASSSSIALAVEPERTRLDVGQPAGIAIRGFHAIDGTPAAGTAVTVQLTHGPTTLQERVKLDASGRGRVTFAHPPLGTDFALAEATVDGKRALDAAAVTVEPSALEGQTQSAPDFGIALDRRRYRPGERVGMSASLPGATGDALVSLDGAQVYALRTVPVHDGRAATALDLRETLGDDRIDATFVRDGAVYASSAELAVDGPGHPRQTALSADRTVYAPGQTARITVHDGDLAGGATVAMRLTDTRPNRGAAFDDAPDILAASATAAQSPAAAEEGGWHSFVTPARSTAGNVLGFDHPRTVGSPDAALALAAPRTLVWRVERVQRSTLDVDVPNERGRYVLSVLKIADDGDVGAASLAIVVQ